MLRQRIVQETNAGQTYLEYAIVVATIAFLLFAMSTMIKRGVQSLTLTVADQVGNQGASDQLFDGRGSLQVSNVVIRTNVQKTEIGYGTYQFNEATQTNGLTVVDLGFTSNVAP